jgi:hypothetical protein
MIATLVAVYTLSILLSVAVSAALSMLVAYRSYNQHMLLSLALLYLFYYTSYSTVNSCSSLSYTINNNLVALNLPLLNNTSNCSLTGSSAFSCTDSSLLLNGAETKSFALTNSNFRTSQIYYTNLSDLPTKLVISDFYNAAAICAILLLSRLNLSYINYSITKF